MSVNRRSFLKLLAGASGTLAAVPANASPAKEATVPDSERLGVLVDTTYCIGCRSCEASCNEANDLPKRDRKSFEDTSVFEKHRRPDATAYTVVNRVGTTPAEEGGAPIFSKVQCMHCIKPACASACIVGALEKTPQGPVVYDAWECLGCRYCMIACPFQIPAYEYADPLTPRVQKCSMCSERTLKQGLQPACVENCPNEALVFGTRSELLDLARIKMRTSPGRYDDHIYGETDAGGTSWMYLAKIDFEKLDLPKLGDRPTPEMTESIQHAVFKGFVPPFALYGLLGLIYWSRTREDAQDQGQGGEGRHE